MNALVPITPTSNVEAYRASTDAATLCREIVLASAMEIQKRKYVKVEGWQAIAIAHGCVASARDVERVDGGVRAIGEVRRMSDGALIAQAEGFVGEDEPTWFGGTVETEEWTGPRGNRRKTGKMISKELPKRADYAIRAMAQTRAISRACRSAFAHVVVMMNADLSTTPFEEVPEGGFDDYREAGAAESKEVANPQEHGLFIACKAAIDLCVTKEAHQGWAKDNEASLAKIQAEEPAVYDAVLAYWRGRLKAAPKAEAAPKSPPEDDFGLNGDDVPEFA